MDAETEKQIEVLEKLYEENASCFRYFVDWRYKVMLRYVIAFATSFLLLKLVLDYKEHIPLFLWLAPTLFISISSLVALVLDRRTEVIIEETRREGKWLESNLFSLSNLTARTERQGGFYSAPFPEEGLTYRKTLPLLYAFTSLLFVVAYVVGTIALYKVSVD